MTHKTYVVYVHINKINYKVYVGQTCDIERRWRNGKGYLRNNTRFSSAIKKYGWNNFEHIILEENLTKSQADFYECMYIRTYDSTNPIKGYNLTFGGAVHYFTEEVKTKMKLNHADFRGSKSCCFGKRLKDILGEAKYEEWRLKIQQYQNEHKRGKSVSAKQVYCVELNKTFECLIDAAEECNTSVSSISLCLSKNRMATRNKETGEYYHWCLPSEIDEYCVPELNVSLQRGQFHPKAQKIYCPELDESFCGVGEVNRKYNLNACHIYDCLSNKRLSCGKHPITNKPLHWCYYDEKDDYVAPSSDKSNNVGKYHHSAKAVYCVELQEVFDTAVSAANKYGFSKQHIGNVCRGKRKTCGVHPQTKQKLHWLFLKDAIDCGYIAHADELST